MKYREIKPGKSLKQYVKLYYIYESDSDITFDDTVFPSGNVEIIFNLGNGKWQVAEGNRYNNTPGIELWGQILRPLPIRSIGKNIMLGVRFFPHAATYFLNEKIELFNNCVTDFSAVSGKEVTTLHSLLFETNDWSKRIELVENFLLSRLSLSEIKMTRAAVVNNVINEIRQPDFFDNMENVAARYGITSRYLQKLFLQHTGLTPKLYTKINRFQNSLRLVTQNKSSLTSIAYDCGYFDQSHFIREFKTFTGVTPSGYLFDSSPITAAFANN